MKERFQSMNTKKRYPVTFGTFHGIYYGILKWAYRLTSENIFSEEQKYQLLRNIIERMELDIEDEKDFLQGISSEISNIKNNQLKLDEYEAVNCSNNVFCQIYERYESERKKYRKVGAERFY